MSWRLIAAVGIGGAVGALARAGVVEVFSENGSLALLVVNVFGSFLLGVIVIRFVDAPTHRAGLGIGFCGAFTSMSSFAVDVAIRLESGQVAEAAMLAAATPVLAALGAIVGIGLVRRR
ncbi:MAG: fluoride efflux transporter FluC [Acidimicrobiales bacterium]